MPAADSDRCQVDFYVLENSSAGGSEQACRLALMAWEQGWKAFVVCASVRDAAALDRFMWEYPPGRFLPHASSTDENAARAAVNIGPLADLNPADVVINLGHDPIPEPGKFRRVLEIVPFAEDERRASRAKYRYYRGLGLTPRTNDVD